MDIIISGVRIIEDSDNRGSDNRGCTVVAIATATCQESLNGLSFVRSMKKCYNPNCPMYIYSIYIVFLTLFV